MLKKYPDAADLDDWRFKFRAGLTALSAVHTAMTEGASAPESFTDGLYFVYNSLAGLAKELDALLDLRPGPKAAIAHYVEKLDDAQARSVLAFLQSYVQGGDAVCAEKST